MSMLLLMDDGPPFPRSLFASGEQGIWLDPSDFSTLFQNSAGTTPVTAVGQPVGLALDKRLGLALGAEKSAYSGGFSSTAGISSIGVTSTIDGTELVVASTSTDGSDRAEIPVSGLTVGATYRATIIARRGAQGTNQFVQQWTVGTIPSTAVTSTSSSTISFLFVATTSSGVARVYSQATGGAIGDNLIVSSLSIREIPGNHASQTTSASRPTLQQDSNGMYYLSFDGTDDGMATPSIDFTGTDKMTVWAGVRKLSDATRQSIVELSAIFTNPGTFALEVPSGLANIFFASVGTVIATSSSAGHASPVTRVISAAASISTDSIVMRVNGTQAAATATDQGTGNYGNYPLYIGRRGGTTLPFNGRIYQLIIRGAASNDGQIAATEAWCNAKTRAY